MGTCGCLMMSTLSFIALGLLSATVVGHQWILIKFPSATLQKGLWRECVDGVCIDLGDGVNTVHQVVRVTVVLSILFTLIGLLMSIGRICVQKYQGTCISWFFLCAAICMIIALFLFISKASSPSKYQQFGWCYVCGWIAVVFHIASFFFGFCMEKF